MNRTPLLGLVATSLLLSMACGSETNLNDRDRPNEDPLDTDEDVVVTGDQPDILLEPEVLSFGGRVPGCESAAQTVKITNVGDAPLDIYDVGVAGNAAASFLVASGGAVGSTLGVGESVEVLVSFKPTIKGELLAQLEVDSNDPDESVAIADLDGDGADNNTAEDIFDQPLPEAVDVLWVIDNSCSMSGIVADLNSNLTSFTQSFANLGLDYQLAVVTTDMADPTHTGKLQGAGVISPAIQGNTQGVVDAFAIASDVGAGGSADERGRDAAYAALRDPLLTGYNDGFMRTDAHLAIIAVSDEPDSSSNVSQSAFISWLDALKGDPKKTSFSAMVNEDGGNPFDFSNPNCASAPALGTGQDYKTIAQQTGGLTAKLCDMDFATVMTYLSYYAAGLTADFPLTDYPSNAPIGITVTVGGQQVPYSPINGWTYDQATNSIVFKQDSVPGPGEDVTVTYEVAGTCN